FFFQAEDGIRDGHVTGVQTCALPISLAYRTPSSTCWPEAAPGARYTLSFETEPATGSKYSLTRLRLAANTSEEAPTLVLPNVAGASAATAASVLAPAISGADSSPTQASISAGRPWPPRLRLPARADRAS